VDGNTRTGVAAAECLLERNVSTLDASDEELERLTLAMAEGKVAVEALAIWFRQRLRLAE
jgi:prophage maintenance system killer protein